RDGPSRGLRTSEALQSDRRSHRLRSSDTAVPGIAARNGIQRPSLRTDLANEDLEASLLIERFSVMPTISSCDAQTVAPNEGLELTRKIHLEIQGSNEIRLAFDFADSLGSHDLRRGL